jgi:NADPH2:quinone reductase
LPLAVITAWEGLVDRANVRADQVVLISGGSGGVGSIAVQIALATGARLFATGTGNGLAVIAILGVDAVDYRADTLEESLIFATGGEGFDIVFDTVGGATLDASFEVHARAGSHGSNSAS